MKPDILEQLSEGAMLNYSSYVKKTKINRNPKKENVRILKKEREAYNLYHRLYRRRPECHQKAVDCSLDWKIKNKEKHTKNRIIQNKKYIRNNPIKRSVQDKVYYAVKTGKLIKPERCEYCNRKAQRIEGHHEDYSKPLDVIWLCRSCHGKIHRQEVAV